MTVTSKCVRQSNCAVYVGLLAGLAKKRTNLALSGKVSVVYGAYFVAFLVVFFAGAFLALGAAVSSVVAAALRRQGRRFFLVMRNTIAEREGK